MQIFDELTYINNTSLALGFFDGLHLGHKVVLKNAVKIAKKNKTTSTVITFKNHPLNYLSNQKIEQILTIEEKLRILNHIGIDNVVLIDFENIANIRADDYIKDILIKYFSPIAITTGFNHTFGYKKNGNSMLLEQYEKIYNYKYYEVPPFVVDGDVVSCSVIRNKLQLGDFISANRLLGYSFFISGTVVHGDGLASELGFPSANINYPEEKIKIPHGVYYVQVIIDNKKYNGVLNHAPVSPDKNKSEVHIIDFDKNIYGKNIFIKFITKIRNQIQADNSDKLKLQIKRDIGFAQIYQHFTADKKNG